ncbi:ABC transporter permease [Desemzia sp. RIT804]|uniref:FtsX-like permease family protein n=1 Tax=Desemzia sp. RIT 804 TaxID=2810209 RepID=UPI00194FA3C9|nr:ABC transporter permease [Desemzia sp. RIT 804]MBM6614347.1 ABC transporter permease [Desemzia sp. RIT 804]
MTKQLFAKLAVRNIRSNKQVYVPYIIASIATVAMFYLMTSLVYNDFIAERSVTLTQMFSLGSIVIGLFSFIFLMYTNSFLIKRRKKEIGLYAILGMKKMHVAFVLLIESLLTSLGSIFLGIISGQIIGRLVFLVLNYALNFPVSMDYPFTLEVILITIAVFAFVFLMALLYNISQVTFSNPIQLVKGKQTGEKEPKSSIILFLLSLVTLGAGYWISLSIDNPISAIIYFFVAVILVIIGTYLLFISGSIFILKALKKNKKLYYRPNAFISISGMLYRMKQNAVGLANISILATMVIIAVSTTAAIFVGTEETLTARFPYENNVSLFEPTEEDMAELETIVATETQHSGLALEEMQSYRYNSLYGKLDNDQFVNETEIVETMIPMQMIMVSQEDIEKIIDVPLGLKEGEVVLFPSGEPYTEPTIEIRNQIYSIHQFENDVTANKLAAQMEVFLEGSLVDVAILITHDTQGIQDIIQTYTEMYPDYYFGDFRGTFGWNTTGTEDEKIAYSNTINSLLSKQEFSFFYESKDASRQEWYSMNGGFLFVGIFLGLLFTFGAILITYFKQVSEGYDDREKFQIMQKVGLDEKMIQTSTRSQIVWMFFLPLIVAVVHVIFAFPIVQKMLLIFGVGDTSLIVWSIALVVLFFSLLYWIIYRVTSRVYFSIVK